MEPRLAARLQQQLAKEAAGLRPGAVPPTEASKPKEERAAPQEARQTSKDSAANAVVYAPTQARAIFQQNDTSERSSEAESQLAILIAECEAAHAAKQAASATVAALSKSNSAADVARIYQAKQDAHKAAMHAEACEAAKSKREAELAMLRAETAKTQNSGELAKTQAAFEAAQSEMLKLNDGLTEAMKKEKQKAQDNEALRMELSQVKSAAAATEASLRRQLAEALEQHKQDKAAAVASAVRSARLWWLCWLVFPCWCSVVNTGDQEEASAPGKKAKAAKPSKKKATRNKDTESAGVSEEAQSLVGQSC